jgi:hypothetical protein
MYKVVDNTPDTWDSDERGAPILVLEDEYGGQSVIGMDDHCLVLYNWNSTDGKFNSVTHWYREAIMALIVHVNICPDNIDRWYGS